MICQECLIHHIGGQKWYVYFYFHPLNRWVLTEAWQVHEPFSTFKTTLIWLIQGRLKRNFIEKGSKHTGSLFGFWLVNLFLICNEMSTLIWFYCVPGHRKENHRIRVFRDPFGKANLWAIWSPELDFFPSWLVNRFLHGAAHYFLSFICWPSK